MVSKKYSATKRFVCLLCQSSCSVRRLRIVWHEQRLAIPSFMPYVERGQTKKRTNKRKTIQNNNETKKRQRNKTDESDEKKKERRRKGSGEHSPTETNLHPTPKNEWGRECKFNVHALFEFNC